MEHGFRLRLFLHQDRFITVAIPIYVIAEKI